jgi:hypothetical protein
MQLRIHVCLRGILFILGNMKCILFYKIVIAQSSMKFVIDRIQVLASWRVQKCTGTYIGRHEHTYILEPRGREKSSRFYLKLSDQAKNVLNRLLPSTVKKFIDQWKACHIHINFTFFLLCANIYTYTIGISAAL